MKEIKMKKILVAYATKYGSTAEIAQKIGEVLISSGWDTDVLPVDRVRALDRYEAVVLGSAVYIGKWRKEAVKFLTSNEKMLIDRPVWLFSSGPTGEGDPVELMKGWRFPVELEHISNRIQPRDITVFHGSVNMDKLNFIEKGMINNVKAPVGDFRNWDAINSWATTIGEDLKGADQAKV
jgi:menaquinone-dependent protoporphyrinogen oxidase